MDNYGDVYATGDNLKYQLGLVDKIVISLTKIPNLGFKAVQVAAGVDFSLILADNQQLYAVGNND